MGKFLSIVGALFAAMIFSTEVNASMVSKGSLDLSPIVKLIESSPKAADNGADTTLAYKNCRIRVSSATYGDIWFFGEPPPDGRYPWLEISGNPKTIEENGNIVYGNSLDITFDDKTEQTTASFDIAQLNLDDFGQSITRTVARFVLEKDGTLTHVKATQYNGYVWLGVKELSSMSCE